MIIFVGSIANLFAVYATLRDEYGTLALVNLSSNDKLITKYWHMPNPQYAISTAPPAANVLPPPVHDVLSTLAI